MNKRNPNLFQISQRWGRGGGCWRSRICHVCRYTTFLLLNQGQCLNVHHVSGTKWCFFSEITATAFWSHMKSWQHEVEIRGGGVSAAWGHVVGGADDLKTFAWAGGSFCCVASTVPVWLAFAFLGSWGALKLFWGFGASLFISSYVKRTHVILQ